MKSLFARLSFAFMLITSSMLLVSTLMIIFQTHRHFIMFTDQEMDMNVSSDSFNHHFELAIMQSTLWTFVIGICVTALVSVVVAKRITTPLIDMKQTAHQMAKGELNVRTHVNGEDELSDLGRSLNHLAEQLVRQEQLRKTMTADVAHELRTPLATLKSHIAAMLDGVWEPTPKRLASCFEEVERLTHLVGDLSHLTEVESPHAKLKLETEDLTELVEHNADAMRPLFVQRGISLNVAPHSPVYVSLDKQRIGQVITNLLSNALKFTPSGGTVRIEIRTVQEGMTVSVIDSGIGIKESELSMVFERFYRGEKSRSRKTGGAGIGLSIVKAIVEAHGGTIKLESKVGVGTEVQVFFPSQLLQK
ncbi:sensor histidine kinase [Cohnella sp. GCM10020058]|uniref:sensor histidine kinase n=1 Tax=Cohnella sp. GCM10020058 TaxID=3317330 RepID=UPI00363ED819